ncbi:MAG TPA: hypothetical protein QF564_09300 [Pirellulaceae bacterium]|nr:hypothetical protein [Pirellulaceae bacterium]
MISKAPRHVIDRLVLTAYLLLWPPFALLVSRRSGSTDLFDMWSLRYFVVLLAFAIGLLLASGVALMVVWGGESRLRLFALLARLHRQRAWFWLAVTLPPLLWALAVAAIATIGVVPTPALVFCLIDAGLVVVCCESILALIGQPKKRQRELVLKFVMAGFATIFALASVEIAAAILGLGAYSHWDINPKQANLRFHTDDFDVQVVTNGQGLREPTLISPRHPDRRRIVVIGDSMTFGWGVEYEQVYVKVAQRTLHEKYARTDVEVVNMGRPGAGPQDYLRYFRQYAVELRPDMVVVGFLVGNDCPVIPPARLRTDADVQREQAEHVARAGTTWLERLVMKSLMIRLCYSGLACLAAKREPSAGARGPVFNEPNPLDPTAIGQDIANSDDPTGARQRYEKLQQDGWVDRGLVWRMNPWLVRAIILHPAGAADSLAVRPETLGAMQYEWRMCAGLLREMKITADDLDIPLVILAIPNAHLVSPRWVDFLQQRGCEVNDRMTTSRIVNDWLADFCIQEGIPWIDPLTTFRQRQGVGEELYLQTDDHMTPAGYALLGEALADGLASELKAKKNQP